MELTKTRADYYSKPFILFELAKQLKYKYLSARKETDPGGYILMRYYQGYNLIMLTDALERIGALYDKSIKLYFDLATWKDDKGNTPMISYESEKRDRDKKYFDKNYVDWMVGYDFAIDLDSDDIKKSWKDAAKIKEFFDERKIPYSVRFSGNRGFHFYIESIWFPDKIKPQDKVKNYQKLAGVICAVSGIKTIDKNGTFDNTIYDDRRILKLPYSLNYKDGCEYVCLPLDDSQFNNFNVEDMKMENVMSKLIIKNRGILTRMHGLTEKQLKLNVVKLLKEIK